MFNQKRSFFKGKLFYIVLLALFGFGIWMNAPTNGNAPADVNTDTKYKVSSDSGVNQGDKSSPDIMENIIGNDQTSAPSSNVESVGTSAGISEPANASKGYYLVKEVNGVIKIFYYDEEGKESLIRETDIAFSLLSNSDQELFRKGIIEHTQEELDELLQDFES